MFGKRRSTRNWELVFALLCVTVTGGCKMPGAGTNYASDTSNPFDESPVPEPTVQMASATEPAPEVPDTETAPETNLASVLGELDEIGQIDPQAREKLTQDLQGVKPELWPLMIQQFKSAMAYRQQVVENQPAAQPSIVSTEAKPHVSTKVKATPVSYTPDAPPAITPPQTPPPVATPVNEPPATEPVIISDSTPQMLNAVEMTHLANATPLPPPPVTSQLPTATAIPRDAMVKPASYTSTAGASKSWQDDLDSSIAKLQSRVNAQPASTAEMHEHVRLRVLQLMAGQRGEAMVPIPGASPALQDYWSKQLFAISTHLNHEQQPDEKRRVASSLYHLDQARAKLAQLATLQVRNLNIVESVDGFGSYKLRESREFRPGEPVALYAEVENLQSESTKEGYQAILSTSYEVVDISGQRVDGRPFPDVEDVCKNPRRDFHMQYGVTLPERIYPGEYQLRLTITDQLSHKIGHASVSFVIVE